MLTKITKLFRAAAIKSRKGEKGYILIWVLILLLVGSLIITPMLTYMSTGIRTSVGYLQHTEELYAADAGVEDGMWQVRYDQLEADNYTFPGYHPYDYTNSWDYDLSEPVNDMDVRVTVQNVWIPYGLTPPSRTNAERIIEGTAENPPKLIITGNVPSSSTFEIKIQYYPDVGEELEIDTLGIWLPPGFHYDQSGDCNLNGYYSSRDIFTHAGGEAIVWHFNSYPFAGDGYHAPFPGVSTASSPMTSTITFHYTGPSNRIPEAVSWIDTNLDLTQGGSQNVSYTWDADTKIFRIVSVAGDTEIEAYAAKSELREMGSAIAGDYRAIGNSLMQDRYGGSPPVRDTLLDESSTRVDDIPDDAVVQRAWLYWSGWLAGSGEQVLFEDQCFNFGKWGQRGSDWTISGSRFRGHHVGNDENRYLTLRNSLDLSDYTSGVVTISWDQDEGGSLDSTDGFDFAFSGDGGLTWSENIPAFRDDNPPGYFSYNIPAQYRTDDFKVRFYLQDCSERNEYVYIDNIKIAAQAGTIADTSVEFKINGSQVYFDDGTPAIGNHEITAAEWSVLENKPGTYSYACKLDVTDLVRTFSTNQTGNGRYTVGSVTAATGDEWSYAGWSLIIVYTSADTRGHQLYLYDDFTYVDNDETLVFPVTGFLVPEPVAGEDNAAKVSVFVGEGDDYYNYDYFRFNGTALSDGRTTSDVWNSWSRGMSEDGVDVDTFEVPWGNPPSTGLLKPGDTAAEVTMPTRTDSWNLIYVILAFRSETSTGGTVTYLIR